MSLTAKQLEIRRSGITAGDVRALSGRDPYGRTAHNVWLDKFGLEDPSNDTEAKSLGEACEPIIVRSIVHHTTLSPVSRDPESLTVRHRKHKHHIATPDVFLSLSPLEKASSLGEAKLVGFWNRQDWGPSGSDEFPDWALIQCTWQGYVANLPRVHLAAMLGTEIRHYTIEIERELVGVLVERADRFTVDHIKTRKPPPIDGSKGSAATLAKIYPRAKGAIMKAGPQAEKYAARYLKAEADLEAAELEREKAKQALIVLVGSCDGMKGDGWTVVHRNRAAYVVQSKSYTVRAGRRFRMVT
jgi:predicted phage-related endonuclease